MKKYHVGDRTVLLVDGDLYERLVPLESELPTPESKPQVKRGRPKGWKKRPGQMSMSDAQHRIREYKPRKHLGPDAEEAIRADIAGGLGLTEACKKYEISVSTYYRLRNESQSRPVREESVTATV